MCVNFTQYYYPSSSGGKNYDPEENACRFWFYSSSDSTAILQPSIKDYTFDYDTLTYAVWWNQQTFKNNQVDLFFDDKITKKLFGEDTLYPNLADNLFIRNLSQPTDLELVNTRLGGNFRADSGFVVTYYKVPTDYVAFQQYNSLQFILACQDGNSDSERQCFAVVEYNERSVWSYLYFQLKNSK